jgi:hypothetical protein
MHPALQGLLTIAIGVGGCIGYFYFANQFLDKVLYPAKGPNAGATSPARTRSGPGSSSSRRCSRSASTSRTRSSRRCACR